MIIQISDQSYQALRQLLRLNTAIRNEGAEYIIRAIIEPKDGSNVILLYLEPRITPKEPRNA